MNSKWPWPPIGVALEPPCCKKKLHRDSFNASLFPDDEEPGPWNGKGDMKSSESPALGYLDELALQLRFDSYALPKGTCDCVGRRQLVLVTGPVVCLVSDMLVDFGCSFGNRYFQFGVEISDSPGFFFTLEVQPPFFTGWFRNHNFL